MPCHGDEAADFMDFDMLVFLHFQEVLAKLLGPAALGGFQDHEPASRLRGLNQQAANFPDLGNSLYQGRLRARRYGQASGMSRPGQLVEVGRKPGLAQHTQHLGKGLMILDRILAPAAWRCRLAVKDPFENIGPERQITRVPFKPGALLEGQPQGKWGWALCCHRRPRQAVLRLRVTAGRLSRGARPSSRSLLLSACPLPRLEC